MLARALDKFNANATVSERYVFKTTSLVVDCCYIVIKHLLM